MNGVNFKQLKNLEKSNFFAPNLLNKIRLFLRNAIDRVEVAGSNLVQIILNSFDTQGGLYATAA
jgi:hypothetical protein